MSGIAGIFNRNGEPADTEILADMTDIVRYRGPDGIGSWVDGPLGFSQLLLSTTPESIDEHSPMLDDISGLCIIFDGRVDNREELSSALKSHGLHCRTITDMELVLKSYELWGAACAEKILGDFAFAIWDRNKQQLFCARDIKGFRPFYYSVAAGHFIFGSEIRQLLLHDSVSRQVNVGMVAEYLSCEIKNFDETLYRDINRLPPAHYMLVDKNRIQLKQYWEPDLNRRIQYSRDSDYVEHYLEVFHRAVECRLRCSGKVGATMSGGLDSTSVVGMAQSIYVDRGSQASISTFSTTFPGRDCDEAEAIQQMNEMWDLKSYIDPFKIFDHAPPWREQVRRSGEPPEGPLALLEERLVKPAHSQQVKVLMSGIGADGSLGGSSYPYLQALRDFSFSFILEYFRREGSENGWKLASSRLLRSIAWPLIPVPVRRFLLLSKLVKGRPNFLQAQFVSNEDPLAYFQLAWQYRDLAKWRKYCSVNNAEATSGLEIEDKIYARYGTEQRHPFCDRRMLEFAAGVPDYQHLKNGQRKRLILEGSEGLIPASLQKSTNYGHFSNCYQELLKLPAVTNTLRSLEIGRAGWVSQQKVNDIYTNVIKKSGHSAEIHREDYRWLVPLWSVFAMETWIREAGINLPSR